jgi:hypothetical protein
MKSVLYLIFFLFVSSILSSCHNLVVGSGEIVERTAFGTFSGIELNSNFTVYISEDTACHIRIQGYENLVDHVSVVSNGTTGVLSIGTEPDYVLEENNIVIYLSSPDYTYIRLNSGGSIISNDSITTTTLEVTNNGSGTVSLYGDADLLNIYSAGSGITRLCTMQADTVSAFMLGSGIVSTKPVNQLNAQIPGSGQIQYLGSPTLNFSITGSGSLFQTLGCY